MLDPLDELIVLLERDLARRAPQRQSNLHAEAVAESRSLRADEHRHVCGVPTCGNYYVCHGTRCAGTVWLCPACELDQRDAHADQGGAR